ncbi:DUF421 domain-containing protein [Sphingobacterium sp. N143]|uniref:DUF421 domain-containing protein n=1 Tax=Sphingobacterium sp. N143 TaxID=2746727 RepID=UPI00257765A7|nr:YetF domain-containing protein [Sphingobacterium sp. N143]MDM1296708.1 DUF421 domain-containing protein [Sphingobacterium sp. N143]
MIDFHKIFADGVDFSFLVEIGARTIIMFLLILIILRLSGRRGVRQLTLFEVAIIISLGSAAGDPMFQEDLPIFYSVVVFICVIVVYKSITWLASRSEKVTLLLEGKVLPVVKDGVFDIKHENDNNFSRMEFFAELRNLNVEHLGQVREGVLEIDGTLSVLFYADDKVRYGLPLFPSAYKAVTSVASPGPYACMYCGQVLSDLAHHSAACPRCNRKKWCKALNNKRV